jgi:hypothetical protein
MKVKNTEDATSARLIARMTVRGDMGIERAK